MKTTIQMLGAALLFALVSCHNTSPEDSLAEADLKEKEMVHFVPPVIKEDKLEETVDAEQYDATGVAESVAKPAPPPPGTTEQATGRTKIIKNGDFSIKAVDINACKKNIDALVKTLNGYYESESLENIDERLSYTLKIRLPAAGFQKALEFLESGKYEIISRNITTEDVTEEYVDVEARIASKKEYLKRYRELLSQARTVKDMLEIENNIRNLQEEIESREGRLNYLKDQVAYSTLTVYIFKNKEYVYKPTPQDKFSERIKKSLGSGWNAIIDGVLWLLRQWPLLVLLLVIVLYVRTVRRKRKDAR